MRSLFHPQTWATCFFFIFLTIQISVPTFLLASERPARWGWQMYSTFPKVPEITLHMVDNSRQEVDLADHLAHLRFEILKPQNLLPHICILFKDAVTIQYHDENTTEIYSCR